MSAACEPVSSLNGRLVPLRQACVPVIDEGIVQAVTVTERIRTFGHRPYLLDEHLDRLRQSLQKTGIAAVSVIDDLPAQIDAVVAQNSRLIEDWQDLAIVIFITPGANRGLAAEVDIPAEPTVCVHTTVIPTPSWAALGNTGIHLVTPEVRQPAASVDPQIKHRSRLHWFLADQQVRRIDPQAWALLLDQQDHVTETSSGNLMISDGSRLLTPRPENVLGGISQQVVTRLAAAAGMKTVTADLSVTDVIDSREAFLTSTGYCLLPVTKLNGNALGDGRPGPLARRLLQNWSAEVGTDIVHQQRRAAGIEKP